MTIAFAVLFSAIFSFMLVAQEDTAAIVVHYQDVYAEIVSPATADGATSTVDSPISPFVSTTADENAIPEHAEQVFARMKSVADHYGVTIVHSVTDSHEPEKKRIAYVYAPSGASESHWFVKGYPDVVPALMSTTVRPLSDSERIGVGGSYAIVGKDATSRADAAMELASELPKSGYNVTAWKMGIIGTFSNLPEQLCIAALLSLLLCALLALLFAMLNAKGYAVYQLHGYARRQIWVRDVWANLRASLMAAAGVIVLAACAYAAIDGFAQWQRMLRAFAAVLAVFLLVIALFHVGGMRLATLQPVLSGLKGHIPVGRATLDMYVIRVPAALVSMATVSALMTAGVSVGQARQRLAYWGDNGSVAYVEGFRGSATDADIGAYLQWVAHENQAGKVIRAYKTRLSDIRDDTSSTPAVSGNVLIVNTAYLRCNVIKDSSGTRIRAVPDGKVLLVMPQERSGDADAIGQIVSAYIHEHWAQTQLIHKYGSQEYLEHEQDTEFNDVPGPGIETVVGLEGQTAFDYRFTQNSNADDIADVGHAQTGTIIIGIDPSSDVDNLFDYSTESMSLFFSDPDQAWKELKQAGLDTAITAMSTPAKLTLNEIAEAQRSLYQAVASFILGVLVLVMSGVALARTHVRGRAQEVFARYIHGWAFIRIHAPLVITETVLFGAIMLNGIHRYVQLLQYYDPVSRTYDFNPAVSMVEVVVICVISVVVCMAVTAHDTKMLCERHARAE